MGTSVSPCAGDTQFAHLGAAFNQLGVPVQAGAFTLVHFSAQLKCILWDRGAVRGTAGGV